MCQTNAEDFNVLWMNFLAKWGNSEDDKIRIEPHVKFWLYEYNRTAIVCYYGPQYKDSPGYEAGGRIHGLFVKLRFIR
jgi:hypothetical protein